MYGPLIMSNSAPQLQNLFQNLDPKNLFGGSWLLNLIQKHGATFASGHEYLTVEFFKDGKVYTDFDVPRLNQTKELSELPCSFRITNVQLLDANIYRMCQQLEQKFQRSFTCNSYYTPGPERNCFDFHVDAQVTYVCQVIGNKNWIFPVRNNQVMSYIGQAPFSKDLISDATYLHQPIRTGEELFVPYGQIHKVEIIGTSPSLHLTFGSFEHHESDLIQNLMNFVVQEAKLDSTFKQSVSKDRISEVVAHFKNVIAEISTEEFCTKFENKMFGDSLLIAKQGRSYKRNGSASQD